MATTRPRVARKPHRCSSCRRTISPGTTYDVVTTFPRGEFSTRDVPHRLAYCHSRCGPDEPTPTTERTTP